MNEPLSLVLAGGAGSAIGTIYFGGLWWTVTKGVSSPRPAVWFACSLLVRTGVALTGFYVIGRGHWERLLACVLGFLVARVAVTWLTRPTGPDTPPRGREAGRAPEPR